MQPPPAFSVRRMCQLLAVSRRGSYEWVGRPPRPQADAERQVQAKVHHCLAQGRGPYGTRRIKYLLAQEGLRVSRRRIGRLLAQAGLRCKTRRKLKAPTAVGHAQMVAPNQRNRAFTIQAPDKV
jgi:putative transposase